jgi:poly(3-hydroxybutyrate) depolymerase
MAYAPLLRLAVGGMEVFAGSARAVAENQRLVLRRCAAEGFDPMSGLLRIARWWHALSDRRAPRWASPHQIRRSGPLVRLRDFAQRGDPDGVPTLILPPQAGHDSCIVDFADGQSQVQTLRAGGLARIAAADWIGATSATSNASISDYLEAVDGCVDLLGGPVHLVGDCQGGWLATIYAALNPTRVHSLTVAGAPIDFHASDAAIHDWVRTIGAGDLAFYRGVVAANGGVLPGWFLLGGFLALAPQHEIDRQLRLLVDIDDEDATARYRDFEDWFKFTQDLPGTFYLWIVERLFRDNAMIRGELTVAGQPVDLAAITCPVVMLAGSEDHITPPPQVFALGGAVSTPRSELFQHVVPGGHLGLFMGHRALREHWSAVAEALSGLG